MLLCGQVHTASQKELQSLPEMSLIMKESAGSQRSTSKRLKEKRSGQKDSSSTTMSRVLAAKISTRLREKIVAWTWTEVKGTTWPTTTMLSREVESAIDRPLPWTSTTCQSRRRGQRLSSNYSRRTYRMEQCSSLRNRSTRHLHHCCSSARATKRLTWGHRLLHPLRETLRRVLSLVKSQKPLEKAQRSMIQLAFEQEVDLEIESHA